MDWGLPLALLVFEVAQTQQGDITRRCGVVTALPLVARGDVMAGCGLPAAEAEPMLGQAAGLFEAEMLAVNAGWHGVFRVFRVDG